jgi:hypothetical protein
VGGEVQPAPDVGERGEQAEPASSTLGVEDSNSPHSASPNVPPATSRRTEIDPVRAAVWGAFWVLLAAIWIAIIWLALR